MWMRNGQSECREWINKEIEDRSKELEREREKKKSRALEKQTRIRFVSVMGRISSQ